MKGSLQIKNNKYYAVFRVDGKQKWVCLNILATSANKKKAQRKLKRILLEYEETKNVSSDMLFVDFLLMWIEQIKPLIKPSTWEGYNKVVQGKIIPYFNQKKYKLSDLRGMIFTNYFVFLKEQGRADGMGGLGKKSILNIRGVLSSAFEFAMENELIEYNFIERSKMPVMEEKTFTPVIYSTEQIRTLLNYAEETNSNAKLFLYLEMYTGARKGELLALTWDNVDLVNRTVYICQNRTGSKKEVLNTLTTPKTKNGFRTIPLPQAIVDMLREEKEQQDTNKKILKDLYLTYEHDYVIRQENGRIYNPNSINRIIRKMTDKLGLPPCRVHDYRHAVATILFESGTPLMDITTQLGHGQTSTTERIYIKKSNIAKTQNIQTLANAIGM